MSFCVNRLESQRWGFIFCQTSRGQKHKKSGGETTCKIRIIKPQKNMCVYLHPLPLLLGDLVFLKMFVENCIENAPEGYKVSWNRRIFRNEQALKNVTKMGGFYCILVPWVVYWSWVLVLHHIIIQPGRREMEHLFKEGEVFFQFMNQEQAPTSCQSKLCEKIWLGKLELN